MKFGDILRRVFALREGKTTLLIVVAACAFAFVFAKVVSDRMLGTFLQMGCCLAAVVACQKFARLVMQIQDEGEREKKEDRRNSRK